MSCGNLGWNFFGPVARLLRKNGGAAMPVRSRLNLKEGAGVTLTLADNPAQDQVDVTIAGTGGTPVYGETPAGTVNGSNVAFTLANAPASGSLQLYLNGLRQRPGAGNDYTLSGSTITCNAAPLAGDTLAADYRY